MVKNMKSMLNKTKEIGIYYGKNSN